MDNEFLTATQLEQLTGTPASTWRYWAHIESGPASFKIGRRRVWKRSTILTWLESLESDAAADRVTGPSGPTARPKKELIGAPRYRAPRDASSRARSSTTRKRVGGTT